MADDFNPDKWLAENQPDDFDPDAFLGQSPPEGVLPGSPLALALASQSGEVVDVETPTGRAQFTRSGQPYLDDEARKVWGDARGARLKQHMLSTLVSGLSGTPGGGFADELLAGVRTGPRGLAEYLASKLNPLAAGQTTGDAYRKERGAIRRDVAQATREASPMVAGVPVLPMAGAVFSSGPMAGTAPARIAGSGILAALSEAGQSEADLTAGGGEQFAGDVEKAAVMGAGLAGGAEALGAVARPLAARIAKRADVERAALEAQKMKALEKARDSARGALGGETSSGMRTLEQARTVLTNPGDYLPDVVTRARQFMDSPEAQALLQRTATSTIDRGYGQAGRIASAQGAFDEAAKRATPSVAQQMAAETLADVPADFAGKAWRSVGQRGALAAGGALAGGLASELTGGDFSKGAAFGGIGGYATPGTLAFLRNAERNPAFRARALEAASGLMTSGADNLSRAALMTQPAASASSPGGRRAAVARYLADILRQRDSE